MHFTEMRGYRQRSDDLYRFILWGTVLRKVARIIKTASCVMQTIFEECLLETDCLKIPDERYVTHFITSSP